MKHDQRTILSAVALCILFFLGYSFYINKKYPNLKNHSEEIAKDAQSKPASEASSSPAVAPSDLDKSLTPPTANATDASAAAPAANAIVKIPEADLLFKTDAFTMKFDQDTASPASIILKKYRQNFHTEAANLDIAERGVIIQGSPDHGALYEIAKGFSASRQGNNLSFERLYGPFRVTQTYSVPASGYVIDYALKFTNEGSQPEKLDLRLTMRQPLVYPAENKPLIPVPGSSSHRPMFVSVVNDSSKYHDIKKACNDAKFFPAPPNLEGTNGSVQVLGFDTHYFLNAILPNTSDPFSYKAGVYAAPSDEFSCPIAAILTQDLGNIKAQESTTLSFKLYFGPKDQDIMDAAHIEGLSNSIDFGFFSSIARPLLKALKFLNDHIGNFGLAIIIVTLSLKFIFYPLQKQASISAFQMKKLQPEMNKLRERYKAEPRRQQQELMRFMSSHKINPMKGCIPILPTIPVFFAFFRVLSSSIELRHAPFFGWIHDLSEPDPYYVTPILLTLAMFLQQRMTPMTGVDKNQQKIMAFLPIIFGIMMLTLPSGMTIYMLTNSLVQMGQMRWIQRKLEAVDEKSPGKEPKGEVI